MTSAVDSRPQTPPHHPIYQVSLSGAEILSAINAVFPKCRDVSVEPLEAGKSYNNRLYFISVDSLDTESTATIASQQELVLKVNGRFWGPEKIHNEVACLQFLSERCPDVPVPKVLAWSNDGEDGVSLLGDLPRRFICQKPKCGRGWILMTRVHGQPLSALELDETALHSVVVQLAQYVSAWRQKPLWQKHCGNICFLDDGGQISPVELALKKLPGFHVTIRGLLGDNIKVAKPMHSALECYTIRFNDKLRILEEEDVHTPNRPVASSLRAFRDQVLPKLGIFNGPPGEMFVFTHYDLSPRNVLVSGQPPQISGIVDFEFAGFFPALAEFVNDFIGNGGDWPPAVYQRYLGELEELGIATPAAGVSESFWQQAERLEKLVEHIAPWWLPGGKTDEELQVALRESSELASQMMDSLAEYAEEYRV